MSKNVAVFVDVANIFYAAKAAGADIDYVTLLKSAVAGRDFVRAYAYTGLDPENENQRQFHSFLARNGYKVVSKDIRKYGDGRIKANLDIELVVDLMRTSRNLDVAVVVSGDGDFAPAIRAVQQMGVRVEVISFRGNTSSDLMDVADVFTDISQIARVEKGSSRSGRRVAAEDDLSMTEVPDKETEGAARRRRGGRGRSGDRVVEPVVARAAVAAREPLAAPGNLIVLPGEKLSRVVVDVPDDSTDANELDLEQPLAGIADEASEEGLTEDGPRRRRRRGGRGRGRGRGGEPEFEPAAVRGAVDQAEGEDAEGEPDIEPETIRTPQASTFGSVWDTQLGVPATPMVATSRIEEEEYDDEPEIPEYLLTERRGPRSGGGGGGRGQAGANRMVTGGRRGAGGGGRGGGYQSAIDRERYGRGGGSMTQSPFSGPRRDPRPQERPAGNRPPRTPRPERPAPMRPAHQPAAGSDPWTEVPPEVEELLRAELARRGGPTPERQTRRPERQTGRDAGSPMPSGRSGQEQPSVQAEASAEERRAEAEAAADATAEAGSAAAEARSAEEESLPVALGAPEEKPKRRGTRRSPGSRASDGEATSVASPRAVSPDDVPEPPSPSEEKPKRRAARRPKAEATAPTGNDAATTVPSQPSAEPTPEEKPKRRTTRRKAAPADGEAAAEASSDATAMPEPEGAPEAKPKRRTTRRKSEAEPTEA
ncbi:hypothetical protein BH20CHL6_BH20CHL6_19090 [soil metagenome]